jgi:hypothetical protein
MKGFDQGRLVGRFAMWACALTVLVCGVTPEASAASLLPPMSNVWVSATALGLTLISAASGPKK